MDTRQNTMEDYFDEFTVHDDDANDESLLGSGNYFNDPDGNICFDEEDGTIKEMESDSDIATVVLAEDDEILMHGETDTAQVLAEEDKPIHMESTVKRKEVLSLVYALIAKHHMTAAAVEDVLGLLNVLVPGCLPRTRYHLKKILNHKTYSVHYVCDKCKGYIGKDIQLSCGSCGTVLNRDLLYKTGSYLLTVDIESQLKHFILYADFLSFVCKEDMTGFKGGAMYRRLHSFTQGQYNLTLTFGFDGAQAGFPLTQNSCIYDSQLRKNTSRNNDCVMTDAVSKYLCCCLPAYK
ncbi:uncharacterized protein [Haliotis cracherodii]|uniref:uncharacterized protein n=1 Tax=Haliotis cracherodii TaxID=6455 RepID=UPI0039E82389